MSFAFTGSSFSSAIVAAGEDLWRLPPSSAELERRSSMSRTPIPESDRIGLLQFQKWLSLLLLLRLLLQSLLGPSPLTSKVFLEELCLLSHFKHLDAMLMQFAPSEKLAAPCNCSSGFSI
ncbi:uncharacterized protein LOC133717827 [Rosa rugosa]|uniref:uncharacterized protein LOC133717827 n=1 Tax=Rosa rugosa TaxID=74645 RepID=UPI002B40E697|nr:uncharacterized protein LOC133717827 [Rosa rugosa]